MNEQALLDENPTEVPQEDAHGRRHALRSLGLTGVALLATLGLSDGAAAKKKKKKKKGAPTAGPAGPAGPAGGTGAAGAAGPAGISGAQSAIVGAQESRPLNNSDYGDLATPGPSVEVTVPQSGQVLVIVSAFIQSNQAGSNMSFSSSGGSGDVVAQDVHAVRVDNANAVAIAIRVSAASVVDGLSPGDHTFTAKYRCTAIAVGSFFEFREITVIPLP